MRKTLAAVALVVTLAGCGQTSNVEPEAQPRTIEAPVACGEVAARYEPANCLTTTTAVPTEQACSQAYDTVIVPNAVGPVPDRDSYIDRCVADLAG